MFFLTNEQFENAKELASYISARKKIESDKNNIYGRFFESAKPLRLSYGKICINGSNENICWIEYLKEAKISDVSERIYNASFAHIKDRLAVNIKDAKDFSEIEKLVSGERFCLANEAVEAVEEFKKLLSICDEYHEAIRNFNTDFDDAYKIGFSDFISNLYKENNVKYDYITYKDEFKCNILPLEELPDRVSIIDNASGIKKFHVKKDNIVYHYVDKDTEKDYSSLSSAKDALGSNIANGDYSRTVYYLKEFYKLIGDIYGN